MVRLRTLGGLTLEAGEAPPVVAAIPRRRLAVLAVLATAGPQGISRDTLLGLFWPESSSERARNALSQTVFVLRRDLPPNALTGGATELRLDPALVPSDVAAFEAAVDAGNLEQAISQYGGSFLDGVFLRDAPEFERWLDGERSRLAHRYAKALETLAVVAEERGDFGAAVGWWRQLAAADPLSSRVALRLVRAYAAGGDRSAALRHASIHETMLRTELGTTPEPALAAFVEQLRRDDTAVDSRPVERSTATTLPPDPKAAQAVEPSSRFFAMPGWLAAMSFAALAGLALWMTIGTSSTADGTRTVAVLPFAAIGPALDVEYVADGLTEELIDALSQLPDLQVVARTSAFRFRDQTLGLPEIGARLGSDVVVTGSVRRSGAMLRVHARLVRVDDGRQLWAESYLRDTSDLIVVQQEIATEVARGLSASAAGTPGASAVLAGSSQNPEAHAFYLRGLFLWNKRRPEDLWRAISYFERATGRDSAYALAYAGIADAYTLLGTFGALPLDSATSRAAAAAQRALAIDGRVAAAHTSMAYVHQLNRDWDAAEREYRRAVELNPSDATTRSWYSFLLMYTGRTDAALREIRRAHELDPVSVGIGANLGWALYFSGRSQAAIEAFRRVLELDPATYAMHNGIGRAYAQLGMMSEAIASYREALRLSGGTSQGLATLGHALARSGRRAEAREILGDLESRPGVDPYALAILCAGLGEGDRTFGYLARAVRERSPLIAQVTVEPLFERIRADPRFHEILRELHLGTGVRQTSRADPLDGGARRNDEPGAGGISGRGGKAHRAARGTHRLATLP